MARRMIPRRIVNFANLPIKLQMPTSFTNIREISLKTVPSATKIEIKRILESMYGFEVESVHTLNMQGKKKRIGKILMVKPDYKKAYVTLINPLSISPYLFPIRVLQEEKERVMRKKSTSSMIESGERKSHWLEGKAGKALETRDGRFSRFGPGSWVNQLRRDGRYGRYARGALYGQAGWDGYMPRRDPPPRGDWGSGRDGGRRGKTGLPNADEVKFPWSSMRSTRQ